MLREAQLRLLRSSSAILARPTLRSSLLVTRSNAALFRRSLSKQVNDHDEQSTIDPTSASNHKTVRSEPILKKKKKVKGAKEEMTTQQLAARIGLAATITSIIGSALYFGRPYPEDSECKNEPGLQGFYSRVQERFNDLVQYYREPAYSKLLPDPLPPEQQPPTLVLNLDETLIYSTWDYKHGWRIAKRPGVDYFLAYITQFFEVVIITTQAQMNAEPILMKLDPVGYVPLRFYRDATRYIDGKYVKDLTHLNRDLSQVIIMDSNPEAFSLQPENGIAVPAWTGDPSDRYLFDIIPFLQTIAETRPADVRPILRAYYGKDIPATFAESERILLERYRQEWEEEQKKKSRGLSGLLLGAGKSTGDGGPPTELPLQHHRRLRQEAFMAQHEREDKAFRELAKQQMKQQMEQFKESKMTIFDYMTKGAPIPEPQDPAVIAEQLSQYKKLYDQQTPPSATSSV